MSSGMPLLDSAASGMSAQRTVLDIAARNVAAAEAAGPKGSYEREVPVFALDTGGEEPRISVTGTRRESGDDGIMQEMIAVMNASRAYDDDAALFDAGKRLAQQTIDMGRLS